jgi:molecular chaperone DnaK (HSP70)
MRLGIDFGTTRIIAAAVDRGNYPVVTFDNHLGDCVDYFPTLVALRGQQARFGWEAFELQGETGWTVVRGIKRLLEEAGPGTVFEVGAFSVPLLPLLVEMLGHYRKALLESATPAVKKTDSLQVLLGVPANAHSNQRFLTVEAFRQAGFEVLGLLNEPSAASIEFGHRKRQNNGTLPLQNLLVYDLGGGTFDVSLVEMDQRTHTVVATEGIATLGGDDFDGVLADLALEAAQVPQTERDAMTQQEYFQLQEESRLKKEAIHPNTKRLTLDLESIREGWGQAVVATSTFYESCQPLVSETFAAMEDLLRARDLLAENAPLSESTVDSVYVVGGSSDLPVVARALREEFGKKMSRSAHSRAATAIGLAIQADESSSYLLREQFTRYFGVWREADSGTRIVFDPLFHKNTPLPAPGEPALTIQREYWAVHNIAHFRYLECSHRGAEGDPQGDITVWDEILFPIDAALSEELDLSTLNVERRAADQGQRIEETYLCDSSGSVTVVIANQSAGYHRQYRLGRWAGKDSAVSAKPKKRIKKKS